jgi:6-phosphogluconolactonase
MARISTSFAFCLLALLYSVQARFVFVGSYQNPPNGIVTFSQNASDGSLTQVSVAPAKSASSLAVHPNGKYLYSTSELGSGFFESWLISSNGSLTRLNSVSSNGNSPAHLSVHSSGRYLLGSNYGTGNFLVFTIQNDGSIGKKLFDEIPGVASWSIPDRQESPHAHMITTAPNGNIIGVDLGSDRVFSWNLDVNSGRVTPNIKTPYAQVLSGSGSRHIVFHHLLSTAYVVNEMGNSIDAFKYDNKTGSFSIIQHISTLSGKFNGYTAAGEIRIHPNGKYLYATNRGADNIAVFSIDGDGGLSSKGWFSSFGSFPRGMNIDPEGRFLYIGNQKGNNVVVYSLEEGGAKLERKSQNYCYSAVDIEFSL